MYVRRCQSTMYAYSQRHVPVGAEETRNATAGRAASSASDDDSRPRARVNLLRPDHAPPVPVIGTPPPPGRGGYSRPSLSSAAAGHEDAAVWSVKCRRRRRVGRGNSERARADIIITSTFTFRGPRGAGPRFPTRLVSHATGRLTRTTRVVSLRLLIRGVTRE